METELIPADEASSTSLMKLYVELTFFALSSPWISPKLNVKHSKIKAVFIFENLTLFHSLKWTRDFIFKLVFNYKKLLQNICIFPLLK